MGKAEKIKKLLNELGRRYREHHITAFSAQMSYFFILSLFPFLIFLYSLTGFFSVDMSWILDNLTRMLPEEAAQIILDYINQLIAGDTSIISVSIIATLWSASKAINALMRALNVVYEVPETRGFFKVRIVGMLYVLLFALAIIFALVLPSMGRGFFEMIRQFVDVPQIFVDRFTSFRWVGVLVFLILVIGSTHVVMPNAKVPFRAAIPGTIFSVFGWTILSFGFSFFINNFGRFSVIYGSLTAVIILMMWMYMSGIILMFGGELNHYLLEQKNDK